LLNAQLLFAETAMTRDDELELKIPSPLRANSPQHRAARPPLSLDLPKSNPAADELPPAARPAQHGPRELHILLRLRG
jgi:hypothetical protein